MKKTILLSVSLVAFLSTAAFAVKPPGHPTSDSGPMMGGDAQQSGEALSGKVLETMNSGGYTYVNLQKKSGDKVWVAVPESSVKVGSELSVSAGNEMQNFESKSLKRTFKSIIFSGGILSAQGATAKTAASGKDQGSAPGAS